MRQRALPPGGERERLRAELVWMYTGYLRALAQAYAGRGEPVEDIEQAAMVGLVEAINRFDPAVGDRFLPFARLTMLGEIKRHFRDRTWRIRVPRRIQELRAALRTAERAFTATYHQPPTVSDLADLLHITEHDVAEVLGSDSAYSPASLDMPLNDDSDAATFGEMIADPHSGPGGDLDTIDNLAALRPLLTTLPERQQRIVLLRFWGNRTQDEIAEDIGISQMHVSRLLRRALQQLRTALLTDPPPATPSARAPIRSDDRRAGAGPVDAAGTPKGRPPAGVSRRGPRPGMFLRTGG